MTLLPPVYEIGPFCLCVCPLVNTFMTEPFDIGTAQHHDIMWLSTTSCDITVGRHLTSLGKNTDKEGTTREGASTLIHFHLPLDLAEQ